ncbi:MAG: phage terminase large subunit family protein [Sphingomonadaceae bacterium]|nr:phage terminase large subunit family protein [Sphingomonadaceae bacterium]
MLLVQPKEDAAEQFSKERIGPLIKATPALRALIGTAKTRSADETLTYKSFPGGFLALVGAGSPDNLARRPVRVVAYDETDKYPITREGDPIDLGDERLATFANWLSLRACSPTIAEESRIAASHDAGDQRRASIACPDCGHRMFPDFFDHVEWEGGKDGEPHRPETARIYCEACGSGWSEGQRLRALATIQWHQTRPFDHCGERQQPLEAYKAAWSAAAVDPVGAVWDWWSGPRHAVHRAKCAHCGEWAVPNEHASFQAGKLYSPWPRDTPDRIARKWLAAQDDEDKKQAWWNTQAGWPYRRHQGRELKVETLASRGEVWPADVPDGVAVLTAGIDVQDYRIEIEIVGWGRNEESWSIDYEVIDGEFDQPATQAALDAYLMRVRKRADGRGFEVAAACIDSGGHHTEAVYQFAKARLGRRVWAIKGESARTGQRNPVWPVKRPQARSKKSFRPVIIGVNAAKDFIRTALGRERLGPNYMHFPASRDIGYFQQLTAERSITKVVSGRKFRVWELPPGRANEALDCRVYAYAALAGLLHMGLKLNKRAGEVGAAETVDERPAVEAAEPQTATAPLRAPAKYRGGASARLA